MRDEALCWMPETEEDRRRVLQELTAILASKHFQKSKRYRALLRFLVERTLEGQPSHLKERTLGIEVFDRSPDYDTNADPVVRFSAAEVRKRIAQYYHEAEELGAPTSGLHIELPLGSYAPEFRVKSAPDTSIPLTEPIRNRTNDNFVLPLPSQNVGNASDQPIANSRKQLFMAIAAAIVLLLGGGGLAAYHRLHPNPLDAMWSPLSQSSEPVVIVLGHGNLAQEPPQTTLYDHMMGSYDHISLSSSIALARITNSVEKRNRTYAVKMDTAANLDDLRGRSVIVIGALNNDWALRLIDQTRFHFVAGPLARIEDMKNPQNKDWVVDFSQPFSRVTHDYAIVARYHDILTNGTTMIIAGLGPYGTESASEFVTSSGDLDQVSRQVGGDWMSQNLEMVIRTDVVGGHPGQPNLVAVSMW